MTPPRRSTSRAFTVALCSACRSPLSHALLEELRVIVRRSENGILVKTNCLLGEFTCRVRNKDGPGPVLMLQAGPIERLAIVTATWIGPINSAEDVRFVCAWLERGQWETDQLPDRLRFDRRRTARAVANN